MPCRGRFEIVRTLDELRRAYQEHGPSIVLSASFSRPLEKCPTISTLDSAEEIFAVLKEEGNPTGEVGIAKAPK